MRALLEESIEISPAIKNISEAACPHRNLHRLGSPRDMYNAAMTRADVITRNRSKIIEAWNSGAIDGALTRQVILQDTVEAYAIVLLVLDAFTTVHNSIPLQGTDKVEVSYFPLQATASTSFVSGTGYTTTSDWVQNSREISVGGDGNSATSGSNAATGTARDRLYQMLMFRSYDMARMPYLNAKKLVEQAANKLGVDMVTQVIQRVITKANFSDAIATIATSGTFSADDVATLREYCTGQNWPQGTRSLVIDHTRYTPLLKDPSFKQYLAYGDSDPIQGGKIENAYGFTNIIEVPNLLSYSPAGENLVAWVNHKSAVLVATAPIMPSPEVLNLLSSYSVAVDARTGAALSFRSHGDAVKDQGYNVAEVAFGAAKGVDKALGRINGA